MSSKTTLRLIDAIEWCKLENGWSDMRFGREFCRDPHFVRDLRCGDPRSRKGRPRRMSVKKRRELIEFLNKHTRGRQYAAG